MKTKTDKAGNKYLGERIKTNYTKGKIRGFTTVKYNDEYIEIHHGGNMGNNLNSVKKNVDSMFGEGTFDKIYGERNYEKGWPDYWYELQAKNNNIV